MKKYIFLLILFVGCKPQEKIVYVPVQDSTYVENTTSIKDSSTWTDPQELILQAIFECDSEKNVIIKRLQNQNTGLQSDLLIDVDTIYLESGETVKRLKFDLSIYVDSIEIKNRQITQLQKMLEVKPKVIEVEKPVKFTPKWKNRCTLGFFILLALNLGFLYFWVKRKFLRGGG